MANKSHTLLIIYTAFLITIINACDILVFKIINFHGFKIAASGLLFPISFYVLNIITEVYGFKATERTIFYIIGSEILFTIIVSMIIKLPSPASNTISVFYYKIFHKLWVISISGTLALLGAFYINSFILSKSKILFKGHFFMPRILIANAISKAILVFSYIIPFWGIFSVHKILFICLDTWLFKMAATIVIIYFAPIVAKHTTLIDKTDIYDIDTSYNPFLSFQKKRSGINMYGEKLY